MNKNEVTVLIIQIKHRTVETKIKKTEEDRTDIHVSRNLSTFVKHQINNT